MSVRYVAATSGWRKWFRWLRVRYRPYLAAYISINAAWARMNGGNYWGFDGPTRDPVAAQWRARGFEADFWNNMRRRAWEERVRDYPHGIAESYIGGPLVIP